MTLFIVVVVLAMIFSNSDSLPEGKWTSEKLPNGKFKTNFHSDFYYLQNSEITAKGPEEELPDGTWRGPEEELPDGTWRSRTIRDEIEFSNGAKYGFKFVPTSGGYEIDIISHPGYSGKPAGLHETHRLSSARGGYRICFDPAGGGKIASIKDCYKVAKRWSQYTERYRRSGKTFG